MPTRWGWWLASPWAATDPREAPVPAQIQHYYIGLIKACAFLRGDDLIYLVSARLWYSLITKYHRRDTASPSRRRGEDVTNRHLLVAAQTGGHDKAGPRAWSVYWALHYNSGWISSVVHQATVKGCEYQSPSCWAEPLCIRSLQRPSSPRSGSWDLTKSHAPHPIKAAQTAQAAARRVLVRRRSMAQNRRPPRRGPSCPFSDRQRRVTDLRSPSATHPKQAGVQH
ncbi:hypothetical protein NDU88_003782 [Pleurodeles waltl]|uniref:Uncharacterized protein n=1 Tax=Pleurodeles waltl TaxID=8319 RepID=A0AAV7T5N0_PLEWA|nr:hypothetical protein NDU88_003782 [Pleurodeles waltl]